MNALQFPGLSTRCTFIVFAFCSAVASVLSGCAASGASQYVTNLPFPGHGCYVEMLLRDSTVVGGELFGADSTGLQILTPYRAHQEETSLVVVSTSDISCVAVAKPLDVSAGAIFGALFVGAAGFLVYSAASGLDHMAAAPGKLRYLGGTPCRLPSLTRSSVMLGAQIGAALSDSSGTASPYRLLLPDEHGSYEYLRRYSKLENMRN